MITVTVTVTDNLLQHELQKSLHPSPVVSRLLRPLSVLDSAYSSSEFYYDDIISLLPVEGFRYPRAESQWSL
jgi:hypothetical protein